MIDAPQWQGYISYVVNGIEHRILRTEQRIQDRHTGKVIHEENGCAEIADAQKRDKAWTQKQ